MPKNIRQIRWVFGIKKKQKDCFKNSHFIMQKKPPYIKRLKNRDILQELPFYNELGIVKTSKAFKGYSKSCNINITE